MIYLTRGFVFIAVVYLLIMGWWYIWVPLMVWYLYRYTAYELLLLGWFIDYGFGTASTWPWYLTFFALALVVAEWLKPRLVVYTEGV